jgi:hypothetical protein
MIFILTASFYALLLAPSRRDWHLQHLPHLTTTSHVQANRPLSRAGFVLSAIWVYALPAMIYRKLTEDLPMKRT